MIDLTPLKLTVYHWIAARMWFAREEEVAILKEMWNMTVEKNEEILYSHKSLLNLSPRDILPM